ncbi:hypothetical protein DLM75_07185 [Leptospira stimsonii]|uniref:Uncharacterized protein n=1 Tax=Leptospira stimsonii TaxID=2202203 RepID=A0A396ZHH6_9LEPT|nr:hypothetical protein DLM75_07185 [Leptospira stimsonii]
MIPFCNSKNGGRDCANPFLNPMNLAFKDFGYFSFSITNRIRHKRTDWKFLKIDFHSLNKTCS